MTSPDPSVDECWSALQWMHPLWAILGSLPEDAHGCRAWPDRPWLPLAASLPMTQARPAP